MTSEKNGRVLSEQLRPRSLDEMVGNEQQMHALKEQFRSGRIPHVFVFSGPTGCGKTTWARILACKFVRGDLTLHENEHEDEKIRRSNATTSWTKLPVVHFINAADQNGIDDVRVITEHIKYCPLPPWKAKVIVFDEAHQLTPAAQNALLTVTEDCPKHVFFMFCTTAPNKLISALRRRAYVVALGDLSTQNIRELLCMARSYVDDDKLTESDIETLIENLEESGQRTAGTVLQVAEKFFSGIPAASASASLSGEEQQRLSSLGLPLCRSIVDGNWKTCSDIMKRMDIGRGDVHPLKACILGYMRKALLDTDAPPGACVPLCRAINYIATSALDDVSGRASLTSAVALACEQLRVSRSTHPTPMKMKMEQTPYGDQ